MSPHRRSEQELDTLAIEAQAAKAEAERQKREALENRTMITGLVAALKQRRGMNHLGRDFEITMKAHPQT